MDRRRGLQEAITGCTPGAEAQAATDVQLTRVSCAGADDSPYSTKIASAAICAARTTCSVSREHAVAPAVSAGSTTPSQLRHGIVSGTNVSRHSAVYPIGAWQD